MKIKRMVLLSRFVGGVLYMGFIFELMADLLLEGSMEIASNRKISK